jgi:hypothetical protein
MFIWIALYFSSTWSLLGDWHALEHHIQMIHHNHVGMVSNAVHHPYIASGDGQHWYWFLTTQQESCFIASTVLQWRVVRSWTINWRNGVPPSFKASGDHTSEFSLDPLETCTHAWLQFLTCNDNLLNQNLERSELLYLPRHFLTS